MKFTKMHGLGNDYLYVYAEVPDNIVTLSRKLSDRHFGAGSDGMIYISPSEIADFKMCIFNADGSEAMMCGNGIRCVGKYVYDRGYTDKTQLRIETLSGIKILDLEVKEGKVESVAVDMGKAVVDEDIKLAVGPDYLAADALLFGNGTADKNGCLTCTPVNVGNPHAVIFVKDAEQIPLSEVGPQIEHHAAFPGGVNAEFVQPLGMNKLRMRVWERGSGITMACGTGACASVAAAAKKGLCDYDAPVIVQLDGGALTIEVAGDGTLCMTGPAETVYDAECPEDLLS